MITRCLACIAFFMVLFSVAASAQGFVRGRIFDKKKDRVLASVSVRNYSQKLVRQSDFGGNFKIMASVDDVIIFTSVSYVPDTIRVTQFMLNNTYDISLEQSPELLARVTIGEYSNYQLDSLNRREEYQKFYESKKSGLIEKSPTGGFGIKLSPVSYFSKKEKNKRKLLDRLTKDEEQYYIDSRFAPTYVARLTGLTGDSLQTFLMRYRPTYKLARQSTQEDVLLYVSDKFQEFKNSGKKR